MRKEKFTFVTNLFPGQHNPPPQKKKTKKLRALGQYFAPVQWRNFHPSVLNCVILYNTTPCLHALYADTQCDKL